MPPCAARGSGSQDGYDHEQTDNGKKPIGAVQEYGWCDDAGNRKHDAGERQVLLRAGKVPNIFGNL